MRAKQSELALASQPATVRWLPAEADAWRPPEELTVSEWAERHRVLPPVTTAHPGPWRTDRVPYLREIMDAFTDPEVAQITMMCAAQVAKTEAWLNMLGWALDQKPAPCMVVMPREVDAKDLVKLRIRPMLEHAETLRNKVSDWKSDNGALLLMLGSSLVKLAWANSPASLASTPIQFGIGDEVDKWPLFTGREADPISLFKVRMRSYRHLSKLVLCSTPTTRVGLIWREWENSDQRYYWCPCTKCGAFQRIVMEQVKWPEDVRDPDRVAEEQLAKYECAACGVLLEESEKLAMVAGGIWCPEGARVERGKIVGAVRRNANRGYNISTLLYPWLSWSQVAGEFLASKDDRQKLQHFQNSWMGWVWEEKGSGISVDALALRQVNTQRGEVPTRGYVLTAGVDVGAPGGVLRLHYTIRAWGVGETSWLVEAGCVDRYENLLHLLFARDFPVQDGRRVRLNLACIDSGHRAEEVYSICRLYPHLLRPTKGEDSIAGGVPILPSRLERNFQGKFARSGIQLWRVNTDYFKSKVQAAMERALGEPGAWLVHRDAPRQYLESCASEMRVATLSKTTGRTKMLWKKRPGSKPNHWWDSDVLTAVAAEMLGVYRMREPEEIAASRAARAAPAEAPSPPVVPSPAAAMPPMTPPSGPIRRSRRAPWPKFQGWRS